MEWAGTSGPVFENDVIAEHYKQHRNAGRASELSFRDLNQRSVSGICSSDDQFDVTQSMYISYAPGLCYTVLHAVRRAQYAERYDDHST